MLVNRCVQRTLYSKIMRELAGMNKENSKTKTHCFFQSKNYHKIESKIFDASSDLCNESVDKAISFERHSLLAPK